MNGITQVLVWLEGFHGHPVYQLWLDYNFSRQQNPGCHWKKTKKNKKQNPSRTFTWPKKHPSYAPAANTRGQVAQQVGHECWLATVLLILSALAVRHTHNPLRVQEGFLDRAGHMTKRSLLFTDTSALLEVIRASTWEAIIKRSATNIPVLEKGSAIISRKPSRLSMNQMFSSLKQINGQTTNHYLLPPMLNLMRQHAAKHFTLSNWT